MSIICAQLGSAPLCSPLAASDALCVVERASSSVPHRWPQSITRSMGVTASTQRKETKRLGYVPAISSFLASSEMKDKNARVLVVGAGCAGLGCAWHLNRAGVDVTLYESLGKLGGHANTITVDGVDVDTGFMVYNTLNYPNLCAFFEELGLEGQPTSMGFSVSMDDGKLEWCSDSLSGLLATPSNAYNLEFYAMFRDIIRFNEEAQKLLNLPDKNPQRNVTVRQFLQDKNLSVAFRDLYLIPMTAAIWSATTDDMLNFPAVTLFTFLNNHLLLQVSAHIDWMTPKHRSQEYVKKVEQELGSRAHVNKEITSIKRRVVDERTIITVKDQLGNEAEFDKIIFACHPDQALRILGSEATENERNHLGAFRYAPNDTYLHWDEDLMPKNKAAWTSWNYLGESAHNQKKAPKTAAGEEQDHLQRPVFVTYWLNKLQGLTHPTNKNILVSLNPTTPPAPEKTWQKIHYAHPQYSLEAIAAQRGVASMQGECNTYFCGAWMGYGFHEDGFRSGIEVAMAVSGVPVPWVAKWGHQSMIPAPKMALQQQQQSNGSLLNQLITLPLRASFEHLCQSQVLSFLRQGFDKGQLIFLLPDGSREVLQGANYDAQQQQASVTVRVHQRWFFVRLALEADLGMARSYIAGEWEVEDTGPHADGLTRLLQLLLDNMPTGKTKVAGGFDAAQMVTAWAGSAFNALWFKLTMDNTIANSRSNIHAHYDLSNDLFETFLDREHMMYSSALFTTRLDTDPVSGTQKLVFLDTLEDAQLRKIDALLERLEPIDPSMTLLDIGFGWGGICIRAAQKYGCRVHGITLSTEQKALAEAKVLAKGLQHLITFELVDYRVFAQRYQSSKTLRKFDRIVSCEMIEAVGHNYLGSFFASVEQLLAVDGLFVMQAITMPDSRYPMYVKSADFINTIIFPGGCCPSLSALLHAMAEHSTLHLDSATNTNVHYAETLRRWRVRFNDQLPRVLALGFDDAFIRCWNLYLCYCEAGFEQQVINLQMLTFARPGNLSLLKPRAVRENVVGFVAQQES